VILSQAYGPQPWILQCMEGILQCVQNSVDLLSGQPVAGNNLALHQGGQYQFAARTREELQASQHEAANAAVVTPHDPSQGTPAIQAQRAMAAGQIDMFAMLQQQAGMRDPASQGIVAQEAPSEPGSGEWIV